ncbi:hypothetical protein I4U23_020705 [Adineta vaga]|nr:hypothetical protein I4U23_020705 [Adineta vaga]
MSSFLTRYWKTLAITSVSIASSYFSTRCNEPQINNRLSSIFTVHAAEYERRNVGRSPQAYRYSEHKQDQIDNDEDDDDDDDNNDKKNTDADDLDDADESITNIRGKRFRDFSSLEYDGEIYMTAVDFLESIISDRPRPRIGRRHLTDEMVRTMLSKTPSKWRGSNRFFRNLEDSGLISFSEYIFLCMILTKPTAQFQIAFHMFDIDGNQMIDKREFLVLEKIIAEKRMMRRQTSKDSSSKSKSTIKINTYYNFDHTEQPDTSLLVHFFGKNCRDTLNYTEFKTFIENFQQEILEIEFNQFSHGFKTITDSDFTEMLLRYTNFPTEMKKFILKRVAKTSDEQSAITFDEYKQFSSFLKNLEEFNVAMRFHKLSNKPISQAEFQRAVKISTGYELEPHIIALIFRIFDIDNDQHLSYDEFMAVMKDHLSRGFRTHANSEKPISKFDQFKHCLRDRAKYDAAIVFN